MDVQIVIYHSTTLEVLLYSSTTLEVLLYSRILPFISGLVTTALALLALLDRFSPLPGGPSCLEHVLSPHRYYTVNELLLLAEIMSPVDKELKSTARYISHHISHIMLYYFKTLRTF